MESSDDRLQRIQARDAHVTLQITAIDIDTYPIGLVAISIAGLKTNASASRQIVDV
jgi:hypothetical protein